MKQNALIFGSNGTIGSAIYQKMLSTKEYRIFTAGKSKKKDYTDHIYIDYGFKNLKNYFLNLPTFEVIVWAHGLNCSDKISNFNYHDLTELLNSNVFFIASCISELVDLNKISNGARLLVVSSIWQIESRKNKFSYTVSKSALQGLIKSSAIDLGEDNILINAVLPGVIDSRMTRKHLSSEQIHAVKNQTALNRLPKPEDIANTVSFLVSNQNKSITGQSFVVDGGFIGSKNNL